jgi:23S rRNA pseudouridine1911/1915/1917 synthase
MVFDIAKQLLFEDNHLIIVNKLPGQLVQPDNTGNDSLEEQIKLYLKFKYNKPGDAFLGVAHRIDRPVSGAVVFAKTSKALVRLNEMLKRHELKKTYWAIVGNQPPKEEAFITNYLLRNGKQNKTQVYNMPVDDAQVAIKLLLTATSIFSWRSIFIPDAIIRYVHNWHIWAAQSKAI